MSTAAASAERRLGIVTEAGRWSASTRYRALQHVPALRRHFAEVEMLLPRDPQGRRPGRVAQVRYFATHGARYAERGLILPRQLRRLDALMVQRGLYVLGPAAVVTALRGFDGPVVYDLDDAVFNYKPALQQKGAAARWLYGGQQSRALLDRADAIVVSTPALADELPPVRAPVTVLPTVPDPLEYLPVVHDDSRPAVIGWTGTVGGLVYLDPLREVLARLRDEGLATAEVHSSAPWDGPADFHPWTLASSTTLFERFGIGIMPLPDTEYTRAKAGFKLLQYMASKLPVVASPVGINAQLIEASGAGFLAESPAEWEEALRRLASDPALRTRLGTAGRAFVGRYGDLEGQAATLARLLRSR